MLIIEELASKLTGRDRINNINCSGIMITTDALKIIWNILTIASNYYLNQEDVFNKIKLLGKEHDKDGDLAIRQLQSSLLDVIINKLKGEKKVTFSILNKKIANLKGELDYLFTN
jgi:hypothetical protein